jgi:Na+/proline symporter
MVAFAIFAAVYTTLFGSKVSTSAPDPTEVFITARKTQGMWRVGWSFFAGSVGAWVIVTPSSYASYAGMLGLVFYSLAAGVPLLVIAFFGQSVQERFPNVCSVSEFALLRFGPTAKIMVTMITLFNMSIAMLAEYTTIGSIFQDFVGSVNYGIIICVGVLTTAYTVYGGLLVSIVTDQVQVFCSKFPSSWNPPAPTHLD